VTPIDYLFFPHPSAQNYPFVPLIQFHVFCDIVSLSDCGVVEVEKVRPI
jgi:hypothetical protein